MDLPKTYESPDGKLRFKVVMGDDGHIIVGFEGFPWHTHGDLLMWEDVSASEEVTVARFVEDLLQNKTIIAVNRRAETILDIRVTDDPRADLRYKLDGEEV